jgi:hypothetical protein
VLAWHERSALFWAASVVSRSCRGKLPNVHTMTDLTARDVIPQEPHRTATGEEHAPAQVLRPEVPSCSWSGVAGLLLFSLHCQTIRILHDNFLAGGQRRG